VVAEEDDDGVAPDTPNEGVEPPVKVLPARLDDDGAPKEIPDDVLGGSENPVEAGAGVVPREKPLDGAELPDGANKELVGADDELLAPKVVAPNPVEPNEEVAGAGVAVEPNEGVAPNPVDAPKPVEPKVVEVPKEGVADVEGVGVAPNAGVEAPNAGVEVPNAGVEAPNDGVEVPNVGVENEGVAEVAPNEVDGVGAPKGVEGVAPNEGVPNVVLDDEV
jgi:hypothetical protein